MDKDSWLICVILVSALSFLQCFVAVGWVTGRASGW